MQPDLFPDDPRRQVQPSTGDRELVLLKYAAGRHRGITLHGVMRDVVPHRAEAAYLIGSLARKGMLRKTVQRRSDCFIFTITEQGRTAAK